MLGGVLAVDQVSQFAGDPSEAEQNGVRGKGFYNDSDEAKCWATHLFQQQQAIKAAINEDHSFSKTVM